mmetsp:Transcript_142509/g.361818  ORF Transcript_142509/g.361818 Transcript_142509/m.361818 type:complete len:396 (+) Transcript_142509:75-1262(+)
MCRVSSCRSWCWFLVKFSALIWLSLTFGLLSVWDWAWETPTTCQRPVLPANQSGIKVLIYGPQKTGTKSMTKALANLGYGQTFHSEDFIFNLWVGLADEFWRRPENGGDYPFATVYPPAWKGTPWNQTDSDSKVFESLGLAKLAAAISRCGVDALAFDGIEELFWPVYEVSPEAKVVSLNWRTWPEYYKSWSTFEWQLSAAITAMCILISPVHLLPWSVIVLPILELLSGNTIDGFLSSGGPPWTISSTLPVSFFKYNAINRRWLTHQFGGLARVPTSEDELFSGFEEVRRRVPAEHLFEWNMRKHTMADLCAFLGIQDSSACKQPGLLPKGINVLYIEREQWDISLCLIPIYLVLHWANYKIVDSVWFLTSWPLRKLCTCCSYWRRPKRTPKME